MAMFAFIVVSVEATVLILTVKDTNELVLSGARFKSHNNMTYIIFV